MILVRRFVAGKNAEEAMEAVRRLNAESIKVTLDLLGEDCKSPEDAAAAVAEFDHVFRLIHERKADSNVSIKLTQLGLNLGDRLAKDNLLRVLDIAARRDNFVRIDMEGSNYTQRTLDIFHDVFKDRKNVGVVIQAYLKRSAGDIDELIRVGARVRLCKGAYKEPESLAYQDKEEINRNYDELARRLIEKGNYPAIATHDDARIENAMKAAGGDRRRFEFQMLYGVRPDRWREIVQQGYNMRIYIPYGTEWFPYYYRRIRERKENLLFAIRSVLGV